METTLFSDLSLLVIVLAINVTLAFWVYRNNPTSTTNRLFILLGIFLSLWLIANYISIQPRFLDTSLFWIRFSVFLATPLTFLFFLLAHTFPQPHLQLNKKLITLLTTCMLGVMLLTLSPYVFTTVQIQKGTPEPIAGLGIIPFGIFAVGMIIAALVVLIKRFRNSTSAERQQNIYMLLGIALMFGAIILTVFIPAAISGTNTFVSFIPLYALVFLGMTAYAIIKHHLFEIRVVATELLVGFVALVLLFEALTAQTLLTLLFKLLLLFAFIYLGIRLIQSVLKEIKQREELEILTKQLEVANRELKRLDAAKSEFVSIASHQLRTPLTAIKGYISLVLEGTYGAIDKKLQRPLKSVYDSNQRLIRLVNDLLSLSRIESGKMDFTIEETDLEKMIQSVLDELKIKAEQKNLKLILKEPAQPLVPVFVDSEKIRNAILNLVDNSIRYTKKGSITVSTAQKNNRLLLTVQDTGAGMTKEEIDKLFESFSRGRAGVKFSTGGAGLGLYIAKQFVQMHKGKIWAESAGKDKGSIFFIELPVRSPA